MPTSSGPLQGVAQAKLVGPFSEAAPREHALERGHHHYQCKDGRVWTCRC